MIFRKRNTSRIGNGFLYASGMAAALLLTSCSDDRLPSPPKAHPELLLEVYDATAKGKHKLALVKIERLRAIEKTSVFLSELETVERNNEAMEQVNAMVGKGDFSAAMKYLEAQEIKNGKNEDTTEAKEQLERLMKIDALLEEAHSAVSSSRLEKVLTDLRKATENIMISQKIQNFIQRKESEVETMQMTEKDRMHFGMIADIGMLLEQDREETAAAVAALLALEDSGNPSLPKIISVMSDMPADTK